MLLASLRPTFCFPNAACLLFLCLSKAHSCCPLSLQTPPCATRACHTYNCTAGTTRRDSGEKKKAFAHLRFVRAREGRKRILVGRVASRGNAMANTAVGRTRAGRYLSIGLSKAIYCIQNVLIPKREGRCGSEMHLIQAAL